MGMKNEIEQLRSGEIKKIKLENWDSKERIEDIIWALNQEVIGQESAKQELVDAFFKSLNPLNDTDGPLMIKLLTGPTWVWKTEVVKAFTKELLWDSNRMVRINCETLQDAHAKTNLLWAPKSYVWYGEKTMLSGKTVYAWWIEARQKNQLHESLKWRNQFAIILFDEIEKMHNEWIQALLWMFDNWMLELSTGEKVNFRNSIILMTSNIGQAEISREKNKPTIGFVNTNDSKRDNKNIEKKAIKERFSPEFNWRIGNPISFDSLSNEELEKIIDLNINKLKTDLSKVFKNITGLNTSKKVIEHVLSQSDSKNKGARDLVREFNNLIRSPLAQVIQSNDLWSLKYSFCINVWMEDWEVSFSLWKKSISELKEEVKSKSVKIIETSDFDEKAKQMIKQVLIMWFKKDVQDVWDMISKWIKIGKLSNEQWTVMFWKEFNELLELWFHDVEDIKFMLYSNFIEKVHIWDHVSEDLCRNLDMNIDDCSFTFWEKFEEFYKKGYKESVIIRRLKIWFNNK